MLELAAYFGQDKNIKTMYLLEVPVYDADTEEEIMKMVDMQNGYQWRHFLNKLDKLLEEDENSIATNSEGDYIFAMTLTSGYGDNKLSTLCYIRLDDIINGLNDSEEISAETYRALERFASRINVDETVFN